jgi:5-methylcytosine-specific restriction protein A
MMPSLPKGNRNTFAVKARSTYLKDKDRAFSGMDKSNAPFYNSRQWRKLRLMILQRDPICKECEKKNIFVSSVVVDHILPINKGGAKYNADNLQGLCTTCHNRKSARDK